MQMLIRRAKRDDLDGLREFLGRANLGTDGLNEETAECFLLLEDKNGALKGTLGMEVFIEAEAGLLRSLVVSPGQADQDILILMEQMVKLAKEKGLKSIFLATNKNSAVPFFEWIGFQQVEREMLPVGLSDSDHIRHLFSVDNSLFLKYDL
ncbi:GNAT family N-acetyltransferase [Neobacillus sp. Marseille-QA0830]